MSTNMGPNSGIPAQAQKQVTPDQRVKQVEASVSLWGRHWERYGDASAARNYLQALQYGLGALETLDALGHGTAQNVALAEEWARIAYDMAGTLGPLYRAQS